jgi:diguanylate cyclase (GGDEF)-like protein
MVAVLGLAALAGLGFTLSSRSSAADGGPDVWRDGVLYGAGMLLPAVACALRALGDRSEALRWWLLSVVVVANAAADLVFDFHDATLDPFPVPAWSDGLYLLCYVAFVATAFVATQLRARRVSWAVRMDGLVLGLAVGAAVVALWFSPVLVQRGSAVETAVGLYPPLLDLAGIVVVVAGLAPLRFRPAPATAVILGTLAVSTVSDVVYLRLLAEDAYVDHPLLTVIWQLVILGYGVAAALPDARPRERSAPRASELMVLPAVAAAVSLVVLGFGVVGRVPVLAAVLAMASLAAAIGRVVATAAELRRANHAFRQARTDELTTLANRRGFAEDLDALLDARAPEQGLAVMVIDLDGFKAVNDTLGHQAGDRLLQAVAGRFAGVLGPHGVVGRLGGDEFAVGLGPGSDDASVVAERLAASLDTPIALAGGPVRVGASIGVAAAPQHGTTREALLRAADVAMYESKTGRLRTAWYDPTRDPNSPDQLAELETFRTVVASGEVEVRYRPVVDVGRNGLRTMVAVAVARAPGDHRAWEPEEVLALAERTGLVPVLSRLVLDQVLEVLGRCGAAGVELRVRIDLASHELVGEAVVEQLAAGLAARGVPASALVVAISEAAVRAAGERAERTLRELRALGVRIAVDRFGAGASTLATLLRLPVDELVLDRSFLVALDEDLGAQAVLAATVGFARTLGLAVVVDGVDSAEAMTMVRRAGVDAVTGVVCGPELSADALTARARTDCRPIASP